MSNRSRLQEQIARNIFRSIFESTGRPINESVAETVKGIQTVMNSIAKKKKISGYKDLVVNGKWSNSIMNKPYGDVIRACKEEFKTAFPKGDLEASAKRGSTFAKTAGGSGAAGVLAGLKKLEAAIGGAEPPKEEPAEEPKKKEPEKKKEKQPEKKVISKSLEDGFLKSTKHRANKRYKTFGGNLKGKIAISQIKPIIPAAFSALMDPDEGGDVGGGKQQRKRSDFIAKVKVTLGKRMTPAEFEAADFRNLPLSGKQIEFEIGRPGAGAVKDYQGAANWARDLAAFLLFKARPK